MSNSSISAHGILEQIWDLRDRRVDDWPLMNSPLPTVALCGLYFYTVKFLGPWFMKERKPYDLKNTIIVYNFVQVAFSAWLFIKIYLAGWGTTYRDERGVNFLATSCACMVHPWVHPNTVITFHRNHVVCNFWLLKA